MKLFRRCGEYNKRSLSLSRKYQGEISKRNNFLLYETNIVTVASCNSI